MRESWSTAVCGVPGQSVGLFSPVIISLSHDSTTVPQWACAVQCIS